MCKLVAVERAATAEVIEHLMEIDRRRLYLEQACSSLYKYCQERLGYSEFEALKRVRVARLAARVPAALAELREGRIHLTGLFLLSKVTTEDNADQLLAEARGLSKRSIERMLARRFPQAASAQPDRMVPLSASRFRIEFTASAELCAKVERAQELLSHVIPSGSMAALFERALDVLIERETRRRIGVGPRATKERSARWDEVAGSTPTPTVPRSECERYCPRGEAAQERASSPEQVPVTSKPESSPEQKHGEDEVLPRVGRAQRRPSRAVTRAVWVRDGWQCTYVDSLGRRCSERRFLTDEHDVPFALGGETNQKNLSILCAAHNAMRARQVFGTEYVELKRAEAQVLTALCRMGFGKRDSVQAIAELRKVRGDNSAARVERAELLRAAIIQLTA